MNLADAAGMLQIVSETYRREMNTRQRKAGCILALKPKWLRNHESGLRHVQRMNKLRPIWRRVQSQHLVQVHLRRTRSKPSQTKLWACTSYVWCSFSKNWIISKYLFVVGVCLLKHRKQERIQEKQTKPKCLLVCLQRLPYTQRVSTNIKIMSF